MTKKIIEYVTIWIMNGEGLKKYIPKLLNSALHVQQTLRYVPLNNICSISSIGLT
jgi:hypothetical protein